MKNNSHTNIVPSILKVVACDELNVEQDLLLEDSNKSIAEMIYEAEEEKDNKKEN